MQSKEHGIPCTRLRVALVLTLFMIGCGGSSGGSDGSGGASSAPPPKPDFTISAPTGISVMQGGTSAAATVSVAAVGGFTGTVSLTISGLPAGATTSPTFPLNVGANSQQQFTLTVPPNATVGNTTLNINGTSNSMSHDATPVTLSIVSAVQTSQSGTILYLQSYSNGHTARIGLDTNWGGGIVEVSMDGTNFVNGHDTGREVQPALYDLNGGLRANGWDPVLAGDKYDHGSSVVSQQVTSNSLYTQTTPLLWNPDAFGGGPNTPIKSDMTFEQTVTLAPGAPLAFKVHLKLAHNGTDYHYVTQQEFPAVYVNSAYTTFAYYGGQTPWTNGALTTTPVSTTMASFYAPEQWAALVDANNQGLAVFVPGTYPSWGSMYFPLNGGSGSTGNATVYMRPIAEFSVGPSATIEGDVYLVPGDVNAGRAVVYSLRQLAPTANLAEPFGLVDDPVTNSTASGAAFAVVGWAVAKVSVSAVNVYLDGALNGTAVLGLSRPDVAAAYPAIAEVNCGWQYLLNTTTLTNGEHTIVVHIVDTASNEVLLPPISIAVSN